jgi:hypothetical protein
MIEAFATNGANHPLDIGSLPRRARCRQDFANAHVSHVFSEVIAKDRIAVAQEVARDKKLLKQREWRLRWAGKAGTGFTLPGHQQAAAEASNGKPGKLLEFRKVG